MKKNYKTIFIFIPGTIIFFAMICFVFSDCKKDHQVPDAGYNYFPDAIGHWCIYEVDSTEYRDFFHDTVNTRYQVKEVIQSYFTDNQGRKAMRVERYKRPYIDTIPYNQLPWTISRVWSFVRTQSEGEKDEENQRFIRVTFVPRVEKSWNGNAYNTMGDWEYKYKEVDMPYSINSMSFDSTALVEQKCDTNRLTYQWYRERYARNVGLIEKNVYDVSDDSLKPTSVLSRIDAGVIYSIKLVDWGPR
ncbi:MAG: hypothetical protein HY064_14930 [Bacteroidetes bacterium]|nr:hypothetical protein [Bacteroidota bacterium]